MTSLQSVSKEGYVITTMVEIDPRAHSGKKRSTRIIYIFFSQDIMYTMLPMLFNLCYSITLLCFFYEMLVNNNDNGN